MGDNHVAEDDNKNETRPQDGGAENDRLLPTTCDGNAQPHRSSLILPEVVAFLYFLPLVTQYPVVQYWLYDHFAKEHHLDTGNDTSVCSNGSDSNSSDVEQTVQSETNRYVMYTSFISSFVAIFPTLFLGPLTDKFGRKFVFYVCLLGLGASILLNILIFHFDLSPALVCVSSLFVGLSGSYGLFLVACFGVVADITSPGKQRAFRVTTVEAILSIASSIATATAGVWVTEVGYVWPMVVCLAELVMGVFFVLFLIPETFDNGDYRSFSCATLLKSFAFYVKDTPDKRRFKLQVYLACFLTMLFAFIGESNFSVLFLLHQPFCWAKVQISVYHGALSLLKWVSVVVFILLTKRWISEPAFAMIGSVSAAAGFLCRGLAHSNVLIFVGAGTGLLMELVGPMCRTIMSKTVARNEQGSLFAGIGVLQMVTSSLSGVVMSNLYQVGLDVYLGLPYLVLAALVALNILLLIAAIIHGRFHPTSEESADNTERMIT